MTDIRIAKIKEVFDNNQPIVRTAVLRENHICSRDVSELINAGYLQKIKTGYYAWNESFEELHDFEIVHGIIPSGVISVYSAAVIHELTTVNPMRISITIPNTILKPKLPEYPPIEIFYCSEKNIDLGIMDYPLENMQVRLYNSERTVCDFFKYSNRIGNDVALEVLKNYMTRNKKNIQILLEYATKLRVRKYIKAYVEALL